MSSEPNSQTFDYVVVGAGSAGCVIARRLVDAGSNVCLIESGGSDWHPLVHIPAGFGRLLDRRRFWTPNLLWDYKTAPQLNLGGRIVDYPQARVIGGGSSVNAMIYTRGQREDYDSWARSGAAGWSYEDVLPYFRRAENCEGSDNRYHGGKGPIVVAKTGYTCPVSEAFVSAAQEIGIPPNNDFNGEIQEGVGFHHVTAASGRRNSTAMSYVYPIRRSPHLRIIKRLTVTKIRFDNQRAVGVVCSAGPGKKAENIEAAKEVIICAGTIGSPKLLMLSGIGPSGQLKDLGISVVQNAKGVGHNLQDHFDCYVARECLGASSYHTHFRPITELRWLLRFLTFGDGPLTSNFVEAGAFLRVDPQSTTPDVQFHLLPAYVLDSQRKPIRGYGVSLYFNILRPKSRGSLELSSNDPFEIPVIDPNFLSDPFDLRLTRAALRRARDVMNAPALARLTGSERVPGTEFESDSELDDYIRQVGKTDYHPVGTCRMGDDEECVVDSSLKVRGIENLRVADASVMPTLISGNTNAPTIMIAEKAADLILADRDAT